MPGIGQLRRVVFQDRGHGLGRGVAAESAHPGKHFVEHRTKCKDVAARIGGLAAHLLRRHVARRAHHHARRRVRTGEGGLVQFCAGFLRQFRQSEIEDLDAPVLGDENVLGFQVAMDDSLLVRRRQSVRDLHAVLDRLTLRQCPFIEQRPQAFPLQQLGDQKRRAVVLTDVMNGENVGMVKRGHRPRLLLKAAQAVAIAGEGFRKNFQSYIAPQARIFRAIHFSHAACAKRGLNFVGAEFGTRGKCHACAIIACAARCIRSDDSAKTEITS